MDGKQSNQAQAESGTLFIGEIKKKLAVNVVVMVI